MQPNNTICSMLWNSVFINEMGDVFACCHRKPSVVGNVYDNDLEIVWNSQEFEDLRSQSLNGVLSCFENCSILAKKENCSEVTKLSYPRLVKFLFSTFCNQDCIMCNQDSDSETKLDSELLKKNVDWQRVDQIVMQGGEVLALKEARDFYVWLTEELGKKVNLITNGMLLNEEWARRLLKSANLVTISVNAASKEVHELVNQGSIFDIVIKNVTRLNKLKKELGSNTKTTFTFTIVKENFHEIPKAISFAASLGFDRINFNCDWQVPDFMKDNSELKEKVKVELKKELEQDHKIWVNLKRLMKLGLVESF